jgi:putative oxidoreductase
MSVPAILQKTARLGLRATTTLAFLAPLLTRITVGYAFFLTGRGKLANLDNFAGYLSDLGVPFATAQAPLLASLEYVGGICLVLGLLTRLMSLGLLGTMVGALVTAEGQSFIDSWSPTGDVGPLDIDPWVFLLLLSWLVLFGPGPLSLDRLASRFLKLGDSEAR